MGRSGAGELAAEVVELLATFPDGNLSGAQWAELSDVLKRVGTALRKSGALLEEFQGLAYARGRPRGPTPTGWLWSRRWPPPLALYLTHDERAELDAGLTRLFDARRAYNRLSAWTNDHHDTLQRYAQRSLGVEWPTIKPHHRSVGPLGMRMLQISLRLPE